MAIKSSDQLTVVDLTDGVSVILTNESHTFPGGVSAALASSTTTTVIAMRGTEQIPASVSNASIVSPTGVTTSVDTDPTQPTITINVSTAVTAGGTVDIPVSLDNGNLTIHKLFTFQIAFKGTGGDSAQWYSGTGITGTSTTATIFSGSGITAAKVGDMYLNTDTMNTYRCTVAGAASVAKWVYVGNIKGDQGATGAGAVWYTGTAITGTSTTGTIFSGSGITDAKVGDMYLNTSTYNTYRCTVAGAASVAKWVYVNNIKGVQGDTGPAGKGVQSTTRYYILQSTTPVKPAVKPPGGNWVTTEPSYTTGSTNSLYFTDLTVFSDGSFAYSDVSLSSSYEAAKAAFNEAVTAEAAAAEAAKTATNFLSYNSSTGLDIGYTGTSAKARIKGSGVEVFGGNGNSAAFFGIEDNSPVSRVGDATAGHVVVDSDSVDVMDGSDTLASFGEYAIIGKEDGNRMKVSPESIIGLTAGNVESFKITQQSFTSDIQVVENSAPFIPNGSMFAYTLKNTPKNNETISCSIFAYSNTGKKYHADDISLLQDPDFEQTYYDEHGHVRIDVQPTIGINIVLEAGVTIQTQYKYYPVVSDAGKYGNFGNDAKTLYIEVNDINHHLSKIELVFSYTSVVSEVPSYTFGSRLESASIGELSFTEGTQVFASGVNSHAEGVFTGASGASSHAEGSMSYAFGPHSHSEGYSTHANGFAAHTEGNNSSANGDYSHAQNYGTIAAKTAQTVLGTYNEEDTSTTTTHPQGTNDYGTYALIIGNGSWGSGRSNALTVDWLGNVAIAGNLTQVPVTGTITYQTDWGAYSGQTPVLKKAANVVSLNGAFAFSGTAFTSSATEVPVCTIPEGFRPPAMVGVLCQGSGTNLWMLRVNTNGNVTMSRYRNAAGTYQQVSSSSWFPFSASWIVS